MHTYLVPVAVDGEPVLQVSSLLAWDPLQQLGPDLQQHNRKAVFHDKHVSLQPLFAASLHIMPLLCNPHVYTRILLSRQHRQYLRLCRWMPLR
jgi:hypothetical protein